MQLKIQESLATLLDRFSNPESNCKFGTFTGILILVIAYISAKFASRVQSLIWAIVGLTSVSVFLDDFSNVLSGKFSPSFSQP